MARQGKKAAKRLAARVSAWESMKDGVDAKNKKHSYSQFYYKKPGSLSK